MQQVIGRNRQANGLGRLEILGGRLHVGDDLHVDAGLVHLGDAQLAQIGEPAAELRVRQDIMAAPQRAQLRGPKMLLQGDPVECHCYMLPAAPASIPL